MNYLVTTSNGKALFHYGIIGQKWGIRRYQNEDGTLTEAGKKHYAKLDDRWISKNESKIYKNAYKKSKNEVNRYAKNVLDKEYDPSGRTYMNAYNKKLAEVMNKNVGDIASPSGRLVRYVAKRGQIGVYTALADAGYDMDKVRNGVWDSGRIGYKEEKVEVSN